MLYIIENNCISVSMSDLGAELKSITGADKTEYLWKGDKKYWRESSPLLFPFVGRLTGEKYIMDGKVHPMNIHGFASSCIFNVVEKSDTSIKLVLESNRETLAVYPREFAFYVTYRICNSSLEIIYEVINKSDKEMHFGIGGHPGFNVPISSGSFEDYRLRFTKPEKIKRVGFTPDCFPDGTCHDFSLKDNAFYLSHDLFDDDAIVLKGSGHEVTLEMPGSDKSVTVSYPDMPYIGFWHAVKTDAPYVCIEPWASLPAAAGRPCIFEEKSDLIHLACGKKYINKWKITVK